MGIGTTNPTSRLDVNGNVKIDSALIVKDSVRINKSLRVDQDVRMLGLTKLNETNVLMDFTVQGLSKFNGELKANSDFVAQGLAKFNSEVKFTNLETLSNYNDKYVVFTNSNGKVQKESYDVLKADFVNAVYANKDCPAGDISLPNWTSGVNKLYVPCPQVNVGINTTSPRVRLDVIGTGYLSKISLGIADPMLIQSHYFHLKAPSNFPSQQNTTIFLIENHQRELFQISNDGKVRAREVIVDTQSPWPDYVFEPHYQLKTLPELHTFIQENKHLPNVPSAKEMDAEGINIGEMNKILLEKIEELTIYLVQQDARMQQLEAEVQTLKKISYE